MRFCANALISLALSLLFVFSAQSAEVKTVLTPELKLDAVRARIREAETHCAGDIVYQTPLRAASGRFRVKGKFVTQHFIADRPIVLCGFRESDQSWHVIEVHAHLAAKEGERVYTYTAQTPGYTIDHLSGRGTIRIMFDVVDGNGESILIYRVRTLNVPKSAIEHKPRLPSTRLLARASVETYTPAHPDLQDPDVALLGLGFLKSEVLAALDELRVAKVPSKTFPNKLLADVIPWEILVALAAIEQMDDERYRADERAEIHSVYLHYALNGRDAFRYSVSSADAVGPFQFTNKNGNGTYDLVVRECKGAGLDPRFPEGAQELRNVIKAAVCLLDIELARLPDVLDLFNRNPILGGIHPVACYNGGNGWCVEFGKTLKRLGIDLESDEVELPDTLIVKKREKGKVVGSGKKRKHIQITKKIENRETAIYVQKYIAVINFLAEEEEKNRTANAPTPEE